eukprot:12883060-Prorocentrum_lima.AAC.1
MSDQRGTFCFKNGGVCKLLVVRKRRGELFYVTQLQFMLLRKAMSRKRMHPELVDTRKWWMQHYLK